MHYRSCLRQRRFGPSSLLLFRLHALFVAQRLLQCEIASTFADFTLRVELLRRLQGRALFLV